MITAAFNTERMTTLFTETLREDTSNQLWSDHSKNEKEQKRGREGREEKNGGSEERDGEHNTSHKGDIQTPQSHGGGWLIGIVNSEMPLTMQIKFHRLIIIDRRNFNPDILRTAAVRNRCHSFWLLNNWTLLLCLRTPPASSSFRRGCATPCYKSWKFQPLGLPASTAGMNALPTQSLLRL